MLVRIDEHLIRYDFRHEPEWMPDDETHTDSQGLVYGVIKVIKGGREVQRKVRGRTLCTITEIVRSPTCARHSQQAQETSAAEAIVQKFFIDAHLPDDPMPLAGPFTDKADEQQYRLHAEAAGIDVAKQFPSVAAAEKAAEKPPCTCVAHWSATEAAFCSILDTYNDHTGRKHALRKALAAAFRPGFRWDAPSVGRPHAVPSRPFRGVLDTQLRAAVWTHYFATVPQIVVVPAHVERQFIRPGMKTPKKPKTPAPVATT